MPFHKSAIPREGLVADVLFKLIDRTALNPSLLLPLILLGRYTKRGEDLSILHASAWRRLKLLFYFSIVKRTYRWLSDKARNNWVSDRYDWSREVVVVTGGAAGIGGAMVKFFDELGIKVVVLDIQPMAFRTSDRVHHFSCDLRSPESVTAAADQIRAKVGHPTVLINNAGVARGKSILDSEPSDVRFTFDVNTLAHYWLVKAFLPQMVARNHGMIVTVASQAAWLTGPGMVDYASSKVAALAFHEGLTAELTTLYNAPRVRTVAVHPGHTKTELFAGFDQNSDFLFPSLHVDTLAEAVVKQVLSGKSGHVILPGAGYALPWIRVMPDFHSHRVRYDAKGLMKSWNGRQVIKDVNALYEESKGEEKHNNTSESTVLVDSTEKTS